MRKFLERLRSHAASDTFFEYPNIMVSLPYTISTEMDNSPWVCPECFAVLGWSDQVTHAQAIEIWRSHGGGLHAERWARTHPDGTSPIGPSVPVVARQAPPTGVAPTPAFPRQDTLRQCPKCDLWISKFRMKLHLSDMHPAAKAPALQVQTQRLPFVLLPPGSWSIAQVIAHCRKTAHKFTSGVNGQQIRPSRLEEIDLLNPVRCYVGEESWLGYVVFEFSYSNRVVLECPVEGNATYILPQEWRTIVGLTKGELRDQFAKQYTRVFHIGNWISRVAIALRKPSRSARLRK